MTISTSIPAANVYRIVDVPERQSFMIFTPAGNPVWTTEFRAFETKDRTKAEEALAYLIQPVTYPDKRTGAHWLKSTFGTM